MPKTPPPEFKIHVDPSCLTDSADSEIMAPAERVVSDQTVVHHDSWSHEEAPDMEDKPVEEVAVEAEEDKEDLTEGSEDKENEKARCARERQIDRIEAQIQAAARAVVASIEQEQYGGHEDSVLSTQTDESFEGSQVTRGEGTDLTYDGTETSYEPHSEPEEEVAGDSSSHHDGDIDDDDVFSRDSGHSARSSLNSVPSADEIQGKTLTSPKVGEEAIHSTPDPEDDTISRIPSSSYAQENATPTTPSRVLARPPFRTPSSVRAMQMSSPTPSLYSSPRSSKRHLPTVSRIGTPSSFSNSPSKSRTPTRFKVKKEHPLVLLHVTVLPLTWNYSHVISSPDLPVSLQRVKENWRLLHEKLGDTVLERGILLPHPQDSYEVLEERLLEALELPVRPRAQILKCGHYMGPETPSSDEEGVAYFEGGNKLEGVRRWCEVCERDVRLEGVDMAGKAGEQRFRMKIYASNGLMRAGAWAACWREMERVDVEIEPFVEGELVLELEHFAANAVMPTVETHEQSDGFVDEEIGHEEHYDTEDQANREAELRAQQEEEMVKTLMEEDEFRRRTQEEEDIRRKIQDEERMREIYGHKSPIREPSSSSPIRTPTRSAHDGDSLPDLLLKAFKVALRDKRNVVICVLSAIVLLLAFRSGSTIPKHNSVAMKETLPITELEMNGGKLPLHVLRGAEQEEIAVGHLETMEPSGFVDTADARDYVDDDISPRDVDQRTGTPIDDITDLLPLEAAIVCGNL